MATPQRMSDIFASSVEHDTTMTTATPPYSSEGPTLSILAEDGMTGNHTAAKESKRHPTVSTDRRDAEEEKRKQTQATKQNAPTKARRVATIHPSLYQPWTLLPSELLKVLVSQARLRSSQNVVTIVFSKNQNIKSGINKLNTYLGAYRTKENPIDLPEALKQTDVLIAISAQGDGTTKMVGIVDMLRRGVISKENDDSQRTETWWTYTSLTSIEMKRKLKIQVSEDRINNENRDILDATQEEDAFEPMEIDVPVNDKSEAAPAVKVPVLTVWMTKKRIPAFRDAFEEQTFTVVQMTEED
jgi:hypothetical protein